MAESKEEVPRAIATTTTTLEKGLHMETGTTIFPYSVFTTSEKWIIVSIVSYAAWFSTVTSFIYYPAIHQLSQYFSVSIDKINLTVTSYLAVATMAPTLVGDAADVLGRRPVYILVLILYIGVDIAIALAKNYGALVGLRVVQALAISGTISIAYGVIADVCSPAERGSFVSLVSFAVSIAPSLGPILGGALSYAAGWTWIFWFLCIAASVCLSTMIFFLPETARNIVRDGSIRPPGKLSRLPIQAIMCHWRGESNESTINETTAAGVSSASNRIRRIPNPLKSFSLLIRPDNATIIASIAFLYAVHTSLSTCLSTLFIRIYSLNQWQAGLIYLPFGLGGTVSTFFSGTLLNRAYRRARRRQGLVEREKAVGDDLDQFDVEKARLGVVFVPMGVTVGSVVGFGWLLEFRQHIAIQLVFQFIAGLAMQLDFSVYNTLLVDKNHRNPSAAQAASSLARCGLAAIMVSFLENLIDGIGIVWTFTFMGGLCFASTGLFWVDWTWGMKWRQRALAKSREKGQM